jgi:hypothetical protein
MTQNAWDLAKHTNGASPDYIPEDFFLYISAQISVFQDTMWFNKSFECEGLKEHWHVN